MCKKAIKCICWPFVVKSSEVLILSSVNETEWIMIMFYKNIYNCASLALFSSLIKIVNTFWIYWKDSNAVCVCVIWIYLSLSIVFESFQCIRNVSRMCFWISNVNFYSLFYLSFMLLLYTAQNPSLREMDSLEI